MEEAKKKSSKNINAAGAEAKKHTGSATAETSKNTEASSIEDKLAKATERIEIADREAKNSREAAKKKKNAAKEEVKRTSDEAKRLRRESEAISEARSERMRAELEYAEAFRKKIRAQKQKASENRKRAMNKKLAEGKEKTSLEDKEVIEREAGLADERNRLSDDLLRKFSDKMETIEEERKLIEEEDKKRAEEAEKYILEKKTVETTPDHLRKETEEALAGATEEKMPHTEASDKKIEAEEDAEVIEEEEDFFITVDISDIVPENVFAEKATSPSIKEATVKTPTKDAEIPKDKTSASKTEDKTYAPMYSSVFSSITAKTDFGKNHREMREAIEESFAIPASEETGAEEVAAIPDAKPETSAKYKYDAGNILCEKDFKHHRKQGVKAKDDKTAAAGLYSGEAEEASLTNSGEKSETFPTAIPLSPTDEEILTEVKGSSSAEKEGLSSKEATHSDKYSKHSLLSGEETAEKAISPKKDDAIETVEEYDEKKSLARDDEAIRLAELRKTEGQAVYEAEAAAAEERRAAAAVLEEESLLSEYERHLKSKEQNAKLRIQKKTKSNVPTSLPIDIVGLNANETFDNGTAVDKRSDGDRRAMLEYERKMELDEDKRAERNDADEKALRAMEAKDYDRSSVRTKGEYPSSTVDKYNDGITEFYDRERDIRGAAEEAGDAEHIRSLSAKDLAQHLKKTAKETAILEKKETALRKKLKRSYGTKDRRSVSEYIETKCRLLQIYVSDYIYSIGAHSKKNEKYYAEKIETEALEYNTALDLWENITEDKVDRIAADFLERIKRDENPPIPKIHVGIAHGIEIPRENPKHKAEKTLLAPSKREIEEEHLRFLEEEEEREILRRPVKEEKTKKELLSDAVDMTFARGKEMTERSILALELGIDFKIHKMELELTKQKYRFGEDGVKEKAGKKDSLSRIKSLRRDRKKIIKEERKNYERYMKIALTAPENLKARWRADKRRMAEMRLRIISYLNERDEVNRRLIKLYNENSKEGSLKNLRKKVTHIALSAEKKQFRKLTKHYKRISKMRIPLKEKERIYGVLNDRIELTGYLKECEYRARKEHPKGAAKRALKREINQTKKSLKVADRDFAVLVKKGAKRSSRAATPAHQVLWVVFALVLLGIGVACYIFRNEIGEFILSLIEQFKPDA